MTNRFYRQSIEADRFDTTAGISCFVLTYFLIRSVVFNGFTPSPLTTAVYIGFFILATAYTVTKTKAFPLRALPAGAAAVIMSLSFALHESPVMNAIVFVSVTVLSGIYCVLLTDSGRYPAGERFFLYDIIRCEILIPLRFILLPLTAPKSSNKKTGRGRHGGKTSGIIAGLLLSLPVCAVVVKLLISGDAAFDAFTSGFTKKISDFFNNVLFPDADILGEIFLVLFPAAIFTPYIFSVMFSFRHGICRNENKTEKRKMPSYSFVPQSLSLTFLSVISTVYAIYLFSQTGYFFSAFRGRLPDGFSVSDYAVRGFTELLGIAAINFILIAVTVIFAKRSEKRLYGYIKGILCFLAVFTVIITLTSVSKIFLYVREYGLTEKRFFGFLADMIIIVLFTAVIFRLFVKKFPYMKVIMCFFFTVITVTGLLGAENIIAGYNVNAYLSGKLDTVDTERLYYMGIAGKNEIFRLYEKDSDNIFAREGFEMMAQDEAASDDSVKCLDKIKLNRFISKYKNELTEYRDKITSQVFVYVSDGADIRDAHICCELYGKAGLLPFSEKLNLDGESSECFENGILYTVRLESVPEQLKKNLQSLASLALTYTRNGETETNSVSGNTVYIDNSFSVSIGTHADSETAKRAIKSFIKSNCR